MEDKCYIGIDPGSLGFIVLQHNGTFESYSIKDNDPYKLSDIMADIHNRFPNVVCCMEQIHAIFGSSAKATFSFGEINGILKGLLMANKIPYVLIPPKAWQKEMWINSDMVINYKKVTIKGKETTRKEVDTKNTSFNAAKRLFPTMDFRKTERCKNWDDNKVDATLICEYARRKNL